METLYDAYIMTHMAKTDGATSGIMFTCMNKGPELTRVKGTTFTVTYNWKYYPAYPPEYNALHYGNTSGAFTKGKYSHPETYDLALMFRDDIMANCNSIWNTYGITGTRLVNSMYRGSCSECYANSTWLFYGSTRCITYNGRCNGDFRSRPVFAFDTKF